MAKKKGSGSRPSSRASSEAGDDLASMSGWSSLDGRSSTGSAAEVDLEEFSDEPFEQALEDLYEKRATTREQALARLIALLSARWQYEECALREETLFQSFLRAVRRGKGSEARLGARGLALFAVTMGPGPAAERMYKEASAVLEPLVLTGRNPLDRVAAIDALCMMCFVSAETPEDALAAMDLLARVYSAGTCPEAVRAAAVRAWTLLLTSVPAWKLNASWVEGHLATLGVLLRADSVAVRAAAGEAVSLLFDLGNLASLADAQGATSPGSPTAALSPASAGRPPRPRPQLPAAPARTSVSAEASGSGSPPDESEYSAAAVESLEDITSRIQDLSTNRGDAARRSQKERAELKATFRVIQSSMEGGDVPTQKIKLRHGDVLVIDALVPSIQLNAFRRFLAEGFQAHMQASCCRGVENPLMHEIFEYEPRQEASEKLTPLEKRLYRSPASYESKARSADRKRERQIMSSYKASMLSHE